MFYTKYLHYYNWSIFVYESVNVILFNVYNMAWLHFILMIKFIINTNSVTVHLLTALSIYGQLPVFLCGFFPTFIPWSLCFNTFPCFPLWLSVLPSHFLQIDWVPLVFASCMKLCASPLCFMSLRSFVFLIRVSWLWGLFMFLHSCTVNNYWRKKKIATSSH